MLLPKDPVRRRLVVVGVVLVLVLGVGFKSARYHLMRVLIMGSEAPSYTMMWALADASPDLPALVDELWASERLPQRHFAVEVLVSGRFGYEEARPYLVEALWTPDDDLRDNALIYLAAARDRRNLPLYSALLGDLNVRLQARTLAVLAVQGDLTHGDWVAPLFESDEPPLRSASYSAFQRWTGLDDGVTLVSTESELGVAEVFWTGWWGANRSATVQVAGMPVPGIERLAAPRVLGQEIGGKRLPLAAVGTKPVVLVFWSQWARTSLSQLDVCRELGVVFGDELALVALNVDDMPTVHVGAAEAFDEVDLAGCYLQPETWPHVQGLADLETVVAYRAQDTPVVVILDAEGRVCRRLGGVHGLQELTGMVEEAMAPASLVKVDRQLAALR